MLMDWDGISDLGCEDDHWIANDKTDLCDVLERLRQAREEARGAGTIQSSPPYSATFVVM